MKLAMKNAVSKLPVGSLADRFFIASFHFVGKIFQPDLSPVIDPDDSVFSE